MDSNPVLDKDVMVWALGVVCALHRQPFDPILALHQIPPPYRLLNLVHALRTFGFKAKPKRLDAGKLRRLPLPFLVLLKRPEGSKFDRQSRARSSHSSADQVLTPPDTLLAVVLKCDGERLLLCRPGSTTPQLVPLSVFAGEFAGSAVLISKRETEACDPDAVRLRKRPFGFRWFVPELLKHKSVWRDVLLASLFIQLMALATPLFTQVVIDKVVVHRTLSTLTVIGAALVIFMIFTSVMSWVRQYLVLHTGNRVDAVLGTRYSAI